MSARLRRARWCAWLWLLAAPSVGAQSPSSGEPSKVKWGPMPDGWAAFRVLGESGTNLPVEAVDTLGSHYFVLRSVKPGAWHAVIEIRLGPKRIETLEQFAQEFARPGSPHREFDASTFNGHPAYYARSAGQVASYRAWLIRIPVRGGQPWVFTEMSCAFSRGPGRDECEARRAELEKVLATIEFDALPTSRLRASIALPPDLKPGDVISPTAVVVDAEGRPPKGEIGVVWTIGGAQRNSIVWDGKPLRIGLQASADDQALTASLTLPAYEVTPAPVAPTSPPPATPVVPSPAVTDPAGAGPDGLPGLGGIGGLPGPRDLTEGLVGTLGPAALGLLGALLSGLLNAPPVPPTPVVPPKPKRPRSGKKKEQAGEGGEEGEGRRESEDEPAEDEDGSKKSGSGEEDRKPDKDKDKKPAGPGREKRVRPEPKPPDPGEHVRGRLEQLRKTAERSGSRELLSAIDKAMAQGFGRDGKFDPDAWKAAQKDLFIVRDRAWKDLSGPNSFLRDALGSTFGAAAKGAMMGVRAAGSMIGGLGGMAVGGYRGIKALGDAALNPGTFVRGASEGISQWADKNAATEKRGFSESMRDGRVGDALVYLGVGTLKAGYQAGGKVVGFVKRDILPVDELSSLVDSKASLEEKLWAVPAAAAKIAGLLAMRQTPTTQPSTRWGAELQKMVDRYTAPQKLAQASGAAADKIGQIEARISQLERVTAGPGGAGAKGVLDSARKALEKAQTYQRTIGAAQKVEQLGQQALAGKPPLQNFQQAQRVLRDNPTLTKAIDDAIIKNNGGGSLYDLRAREILGQDAHTLVTARKLQLQEQAINNATKRIIAEEVRALQAQGAKIPRKFDTFNATQGSRSRLSGSNCNADFDQTVMGLKNVTRKRAEAIVRQECRRAGDNARMTQPQLDVNIYTPRKGLMDARGAAPNAQATLENIGQTTGTSGYHQVHVGRDGRAYVGNHVSSAQGREGVLAGRRSMDPPPGMTRERWLKEGVWEGHQGAPAQVPRSQWEAVRRTQVSGLRHAFERGDMNQMVKYANRGRTVGMPMGEATENLVRAVAGQKDPALAAQMLRDAGIHSPEDLMRCLGMPH